MAHVTVTMAGRVYRMACGDGEERHLELLAEQVDARIKDLHKSFGEIGDQRITVMAAVTFADETSAMARKVASLEAEVARLMLDNLSAESRAQGWADQVSDSLEDTARRLENLAHSFK